MGVSHHFKNLDFIFGMTPRKFGIISFNNAFRIVRIWKTKIENMESMYMPY
jgi:hypothetical protein